MTRVAVLGAGSWGTTFAKVLADGGADVAVWARRTPIVRDWALAIPMVIDIVLLSVHTTGSKVAITLGVDPGREASSRVFYPSEGVYGNSPELRRAVEAMAAGGLKVSAEDALAYRVKVV